MQDGGSWPIETILVVGVVYFLPSIVARYRGHMSAGAIFALNLLAGWTALGWLIAFVWSLTGNTHANARRYSGAGHILDLPAQRMPRENESLPWFGPHTVNAGDAAQDAIRRELRLSPEDRSNR